MDNILFLISQTREQDVRGVINETETQKRVFCQEGSVTRSEFFGAGASGLSPEHMVTVFVGDYSGEKVCKYNGRPYAIYRTYTRGDYVELYLTRRTGTNAVGGDSNG